MQSGGACNPTLGCQYTNDFGILAWGTNSNIHDNTFTLQEGRGIQLSDRDDGTTWQGAPLFRTTRLLV